MIILSIDPGVEKVGYAFFEKKSPNNFTFIASGLIKTKKTTKHELRLKEIYDSLKASIDLHKAEVMVIEKLFFSKNVTSAIAVAQAQGILQLLAAQENMEISYLTPNQIKQIITGYGSADKIAVYKMVKLQLKQEITVADDDESDAIACGMAFCCVNEKLL